VSQLTVRDVPQDVLAVLREEAAERHCSLNAIICAALEEHAERRRRLTAMRHLLPAMDALSDEILAARGGRLTSDSAALLREDRNR
jgi:hypothetical protein